MITCPVCGNSARWGAPQCPNCGARFVAPPTAAPPQQITPAQWVTPKNTASNATWIGMGVFALLAVVILFVLVSPKPSTFGASGKATTQNGEQNVTHGLFGERVLASRPSTIDAGTNTHTGTLEEGDQTAPASTLGASSNDPVHEGIFEVRSQREQAPIVEIGNESAFDLRMDLEDVNGTVKSDWVRAGETQKFEIPAGSYQATVSAPDDPYCLPTDGTVDIKDFHHYQADFFEGPASLASPFHIGD